MTSESNIQRLFIARHDRGRRPKTRQISDNSFLLLLPTGYEVKNILKIKAEIFPSRGQMIVSYIPEAKHTEELLELLRLRASSPLVNVVPPPHRKTPAHPDYTKSSLLTGHLLSDEEEELANGYRYIISHMHTIYTAGMTKSLKSESDDAIIQALPFLESLDVPSPIWEERAKNLLVEEQKVLQELTKEIRGGFSFLSFHVNHIIKGSEFEKLVIAAMNFAINRSQLIRRCHQVAYDVNVERFSQADSIISLLEAWLKDPKNVDNDSFRINSHYMTRTRKHPMQCLDDFGEKFFRKVIEHHHSGENLYTRAVISRSLVIVYFLQGFISVWDECLLNGHLETMKGVLPAFPNIIDRLRENMLRGSCPRESHPEAKRGAKLLLEGVEESIPKNQGSKSPSSPTNGMEDVEMLDVGLPSDHSSQTIVRDEEISKGAKARKIQKKNRKRTEKRRLERMNRPRIGQVENEEPVQELKQEDKATLAQPSQTLLDDLSVDNKSEIVSIILEEKGEKELSPVPAISKARAKKEKRKARKLELELLSKSSETKGADEQESLITSTVGAESTLTTTVVETEKESPVKELTEAEFLNPSTPAKKANMTRRRKSKATEEEKAESPASSSESKLGKTSEAETEKLVKAEPEYYDDPEALQKAIEASTREEAAWTRVEAAQKQSNKESSPPLKTLRGGFNAVFRKDSPAMTRPQAPRAQNVVKIRPKHVPSPREQRQVSPKAAAPKVLAHEKKASVNVEPKSTAIKKENKRPHGKASRKTERKPQVPVFDSQEEFPSLGTPQIGNSPSISNGKTKEALSSIGDASVSEQQPTQTVSIPEAASRSEKILKDRMNEGIQEIEDQMQVTIQQSNAPWIEIQAPNTVSVVEPTDENDKTPRVVIPAVKATSIRPQAILKSTEKLETDTSPEKTNSRRSSILLPEDKITFNALTKKERKTQRAAANADKPKLSIKERVALRRLSIENKSEELVITEKNKNTESKVGERVLQKVESELQSCQEKDMMNENNEQDALDDIPQQSIPKFYDENKIRENQSDEIVISDRSDEGNYDIIAFGSASFVLSPNSSHKEVAKDDGQEKPEIVSE
ncbi:hypothetical protein TWF694_001840 [Orbilia ellipsospora]|uniref:Uncharacterized protein n=1 Tax=Orbilia ellipsospora TaxID=2528407 RepID=A0AAV9X6M1_9PEZI